MRKVNFEIEEDQLFSRDTSVRLTAAINSTRNDIIQALNQRDP